MTSRGLRVLVLLVVAPFSLHGCASVAKGVTQGFLESQKAKEPDPGVCLIQGPPFGGIAAEFRDDDSAQDSNVILMVHGIGRHKPGYSGRLQSRLAGVLELDVLYEPTKQFHVSPSPRGLELGIDPDNLATLSVSRWTDEGETRELLFYELTWSELSEPLKRTLDYDTSAQFSQYRSGLNQTLKEFFNGRVSDPFIYAGSQHDNILHAVSQSLCWVYTETWAGLPDGGAHQCNPGAPETLERFLRNVRTHDIAIVAHSLGSRVAIDALQSAAFGTEWMEVAGGEVERELMRSDEVPVYMLANQLPLLQLGLPEREVTNQIDDYCRPDGSLYDERLLSKLQIVAFSDPNDVLSYTIPKEFVRHQMDSRFCPEVANVLISVAQPVSLPVVGEVTNPMAAHTNYEVDPRVIDIIARGVRRGEPEDRVPEGCIWTETRETPRATAD